MSPKISVVIPVGSGRMGNVHLVLASLEAQTMKEFEVILVNDGNIDEEYSPMIKMHPSLDIKYIYAPKHIGGSGTIQPRNRGTMIALSPFVVYADSDVILNKDALKYYVQDFEENPDRVVVGIYHWLTPMRISAVDVKNRFDDIIEEKLTHLPLNGPQTHNIARDMRLSLFNEQPREYVYRANTAEERKQLYPKFLACFSGNIAFPQEIFWSVGGFWNELAAGIHEDGCMGLALMCAGKGISFDKRIYGGHIYHPRNVDYIKKMWAIEIPKINRRFHLEDYADREGPRDALPSLETMSAGALKSWGVDNWATKMPKSRDEKTGFRGI
jgi:glycosyltransferase involved in cell wall biosynthesis